MNINHTTLTDAIRQHAAEIAAILLGNPQESPNLTQCERDEIIKLTENELRLDITKKWQKNPQPMRFVSWRARWE